MIYLFIYSFIFIYIYIYSFIHLLSLFSIIIIIIMFILYKLYILHMDIGYSSTCRRAKKMVSTKTWPGFKRFSDDPPMKMSIKNKTIGKP